MEISCPLHIERKNILLVSPDAYVFKVTIHCFSHIANNMKNLNL